MSIGMSWDCYLWQFDKLAVLQIHLSTGFSTLRPVFVIVHGSIEARLVVSSKFDSNGSIGLPPR